MRAVPISTNRGRETAHKEGSAVFFMSRTKGFRHLLGAESMGMKGATSVRRSLPGGVREFVRQEEYST